MEENNYFYRKHQDYFNHENVFSMKTTSSFFTLLMIGMMSVAVLISGFGVVYSIVKCVKSIQLTTSGLQKQGKIVDYAVSISKDSDSGESKEMYTPIIEFNDNFGKKHIIRGNYSSGGKESSDRITVYYTKDHPEDAVIGNFFSLWGIPLITFLFSSVCLLVALKPLCSNIKKL
ncbi:DUF3592 domain-containing protein [Chryseobacterium sp. MYb264]|uniref:DUF3592 domain-containing protein n=1 Tax=Chryseobacterium sp. MYb264 TaxID=2745153 RepID=UPI002E0F3113|nr:DUF3592 domain-containing protein [Chryseobacterium sp. MYb264]